MRAIAMTSGRGDQIRWAAKAHSMCALAFLSGLCTTVPGQVLQGSVTGAGSKLVGAQVYTLVDEVGLTAGSSASDGTFKVDLKSIYGRQLKPTEDILLRFSAPGFSTIARQVTVAEVTANPLSIVLPPSTGAGAMSSEERSSLDRYRSVNTTGPVMLVPYEVARADNGQPAQFNESFRALLERRIATQVQSSVGTIPGVPAVQLLPEKMARDADHLKTYGQHIRALAIAGGLREETVPKQVRLATAYVIIPARQSFEPRTMWLDDKFAVSPTGSPTLRAQLSRNWASCTVLAMALRDLNAAGSPPGGDLKAVRAVLQYLRAERANVGKNSPDQASELLRLIKAVEAEWGI